MGGYRRVRARLAGSGVGRLTSTVRHLCAPGQSQAASVGAGAFLAAEEAAQRVQARLGVVLAGPLVESAAGGEVVAAGRARRRALGQVAERLRDALGAHV